DALAMNGSGVAGALRSDCRARLARRSEGVEVGWDPVLQDLRKHPLDLAPLQFFSVPESVLAQGLMILAAEDLDRTVVVNSTEDIIELDHAVEETPGNVTLQRSEERIDVYLVFHRFACLGGKVDMGEIVIAGEAKAAEVKFFVWVHFLPPLVR